MYMYMYVIICTYVLYCAYTWRGTCTHTVYALWVFSKNTHSLCLLQTFFN